jgi:hypothetical protein
MAGAAAVRAARFSEAARAILALASLERADAIGDELRRVALVAALVFPLAGLDAKSW